MSDEAMAAHRELLKSKACGRVLTDLQMLELGVPLTAAVLADRWIATASCEHLTASHLEAVRKHVARAYHPDRQGGNAKLMQMANAALDAALAELRSKDGKPNDDRAVVSRPPSEGA